MLPLSNASLASPITDGATRAAFLSRLERLQAGDMGVLGQLFAEHGNMVFRAAVRLVGNLSDAEDVTQEVFVRLAGAARGFTGSSTQFPGWLRRVAVRQALMHLRGGRRRREVSVESVSALTMPLDTPLERLSIDAALARLTDDQRTVFLLKEVEGYGHAEIAELLGISTATSEVRLHRARRRLRDLLRGSR